MAKKPEKKPKTARPKRLPPVICACPAGSEVNPGGECEVVGEGRREGKTWIPRVVSRVCGGPLRYPVGEKRPGNLVLEAPAYRYSTQSQPCGTVRAGCPVQLVFRKGKTALRFCRKAGSGEPGYFVPVSSPTKARELATKACAAWSKAGKPATVMVKGKPKRIWAGIFEAGNEAVLDARRARAGKGPNRDLGRVRRRRK